MFRLKISQIDKERTVLNDVMENFNDPAVDHYADSIFVTPRLPVKKNHLDKLQMMLALGFDVSTPEKAMQVMQFNSDVGGLYDQITDMTPQEYQMLLSYVSNQSGRVFSDSPAQHSRPMVEDMNLDTGKFIQNPTKPILNDQGQQQNIGTDLAAPTPPAPYKGSPELVDPGVVGAIKMLINSKKPYATKQEALASIQQLYSKMPPEQLAQQPGYKELMGMDEHLYAAYALPKILESMGIHQASASIVRMSMWRVVGARSPEELSEYIAMLIEAGFDAVYDYDTAMQLLSLMKNNPISTDLMAVPRGSWGALCGITERALPQPAPQTPIQPEKPIVPRELTITPDQVRPHDPGAVTQAEHLKTQDIPDAKAYGPSFKDLGKTQLLSMYNGFTDLVQKASDGTPESMVPVKFGEPTPFKIKAAQMGTIVATGGMFVIRWAGKGEEIDDTKVPGTKYRREGMIVGFNKELDLVQVVLYPYNSPSDLAIWPANMIQQSMHRTVRASVDMQSIVERHAQMTPPQTVQSPTGQQIQPGDFIESMGGASGQVSQIAPDGKLIIQDPNGQKVMKDPTEQFEVIKPETSDTATPAAPVAPPSGVGGPNMLK